MAVLLYHASVLRGGYLGVDVFFVLSGFLITALLYEEQQRSGKISLKRFWFRRGFRLVPALAAYLLVGLVASIALKPPADQRQYDLDAGTALLGANNWWRVIGQDAAASAWDGHLWSLSVEAQFYLVWPFVLSILILALHGWKRWLALGAMVTAVAAWRIVLMTDGITADVDSRIYFATDTRADALLIGAALALLWKEGVLSRLSARVWLWASLGSWALLGLAMEFSPVLEDRPRWLGFGGFTLVALVAAVAVAAPVMAPRVGASRLLGLRPLVWLGGISYALYLWHFPITIELESHFGARFGALPVAVVALAVSAVLAWFSGKLVERPAAHWRRLIEQRRHARLDSSADGTRAA